MISFEVSAQTSLMPQEIVEGMFDRKNWVSFNGSGLVPGITEVEIISPTDSIEGTIFKVSNSDGSNHVETIIGYEPGRSLTMKLHEFGSPLNKFATHFLELWTFQHHGDSTLVTRRFELYPVNLFGSVLLKLISLFFRKAVEEHSKTIIQ